MKKSIENMEMIHRLAWSFHFTTGLDLDDLVGEASLAYCEALNTFDSTKDVKMTTYAYKRIQNRLIDFSRKEKQVQCVSLDCFQSREDDYDELGMTPTQATYDKSEFIVSGYERNFNIEDLFPSGKCREVVDMLIEMITTPAEFLYRTTNTIQRVEVNPTPIDFNLPPKMIRGQIVKMLRERGWTHSTIWDTMAQIKFVINEN